VDQIAQHHIPILLVSRVGRAAATAISPLGIPQSLATLKLGSQRISPTVQHLQGPQCGLGLLLIGVAAHHHISTVGAPCASFSQAQPADPAHSQPCRALVPAYRSSTSPSWVS
jgi:hypothetical protein